MNGLSIIGLPDRVWFAQNLTTGETVIKGTRSAARTERTMMKNRGATAVRIGYLQQPTIDLHG